MALSTPPENVIHPGGDPGENLKSISHGCYPILVAFVWELTKYTIDLPLACLLGGSKFSTPEDVRGVDPSGLPGGAAIQTMSYIYGNVDFYS